MLKSFFLLLSLMFAGDALAATRLLPQSFPTEVVWYFNPADCHDTVLENTKAAFDLWERLLLIDIEYGGEVNVTAGDDAVNLISCLPSDQFHTTGSFHAVTNIYTNPNNTSVSFDIIIQSGITNCELHEVSHALGLAHDLVSDPMHSIMIGCNFADYPTTQELQVMSAIYQTPPDCTPVLHADQNFFIPHLNGNWYRGQWNGSGWIVVDQGKNDVDDFRCNVQMQDGHIRGEYFNARHQAYLDFDIYNVAGEWRPWVSSAQ